MKKAALLFLSLFFSALLFSQTLSNQLLGYQEPYAQMRAQAVDSAGNAYYAGTFKGPLVINGQTIFNGNGGDDVFVTKTNANGDLLWVKKLGDAGNEMCSSMVLHMGSLYLSMTVSQTVLIDGNSISAYNNGNATTIISKLDTSAGVVLWMRKTSLPVTKMLASGNQLYIFGILSSLNSGSLYFENTLLQGYSASSRSFFLYMDTAGNYSGNKQVVTGATVITPYVNTAGTLFFLVNIFSASNLQVGDQVIDFPSKNHYQVLVKTDRSFTNLQYKVLNPNAEGYGFNLYQEEAGFTVSSGGDSLYMVLGGISNNGNYKLDGFDVPVGDQSVLLTVDTNLITKQVRPLTPHRISGSPFRVDINHLLADNEYYYLKGTVRGNNSALQIAGITQDKQAVELVYGLIDTVDLNGASKGFVIKIAKKIDQAGLLWIGDLSFYQANTLNTPFYTLNNSKLFFLHEIDNVWNPWVADTSLRILKGSMKKNADRGEITSYVKYFSDGSKIIVGLAKGKTAIDVDSTNIASNQLKSDLFFVLMKQNEQVGWYKRMAHSFSVASIQKTVTQNDKVYVSFKLTGPANSGGNNYIRIDTSTYFVTPTNSSTTGILIFDKNGKFRLLQMAEPFNTSAFFDVFPNGDMAVLSGWSGANVTVPGKLFLGSLGLYAARVDTLGTIKDAVKFLPLLVPVLPPVDIITDGSADGFNVLSPALINAGVPGNSYGFHNGISGSTEFFVANPQPAASSNREYLLIVNANFTSIKNYSTVGPITGSIRTSALLKNKHYLIVAKTGIKDSIYYNSNLMIADSNSNVRFILSVDTALNYYKHKVFGSANNQQTGINFTNLTTYGNHLYASGSNVSSILIDTIQIGHAGATDAVTVQFDSSLHASRVFRLASANNETMYGCDLYLDSIISFAYTAQGIPTFVNGRLAGRNTTTESPDLDENAYIQTILLKTGVVTSVDEPLRVEGLKLFPNPVQNNTVFVDLGTTTGGRYQWLLYNAEGRLIESNMLMWNPGQTKQIRFRNNLPKGSYVLVIKTGQQQTFRAAKLTVLQ